MHVLTIDSPWQDALRFRPLLAERLNAFQSGFWERPRASLREFFSGDLGVLESLLREAARWAVPAKDSPWEQLPVVHLLDHLTQNHRVFFGVMLLDIRRLFEIQEPLDAETEVLRRDIEAFMTELRTRADNDEQYLFARVLRYEACLRDPKVNPEFSGGSLRIAVAYRTAQPRTDVRRMLADLVARLGDLEAARAGNSWLGLLEHRLEDFQVLLAEHEALKADTLYPMALAVEKRLYNLSIAGSAAQAALPQPA
jgi:hypothetical protein